MLGESLFSCSLASFFCFRHADPIPVLADQLLASVHVHAPQRQVCLDRPLKIPPLIIVFWLAPSVQLAAHCRFSIPYHLISVPFSFCDPIAYLYIAPVSKEGTIFLPFNPCLSSIRAISPRESDCTAVRRLRKAGRRLRTSCARMHASEHSSKLGEGAFT